MKNIYDILAGIGLEVPQEKKADFDRELAANYKTVADYEKQTAKVGSLTEQLDAAKEGLKAFEGVDVQDLQGKITSLQNDLAAKDAEYSQKLLDIEFDGLLTDGIREAGGINPKAIRALLDVDGLKASKNQKDDIAAAIKALKESDGNQFKPEREPKPDPQIITGGGAGGNPQAGSGAKGWRENLQANFIKARKE